MRAARFVWTAHGLICETPAPMTPRGRARAATFALAVNRQRYARLPAGDRRDAVARVIRALERNAFIERPMPRFDQDREVVLYGV